MNSYREVKKPWQKPERTKYTIEGNEDAFTRTTEVEQTYNDRALIKTDKIVSNTQLANIRIVLVRPFAAGNIGAAARAMKTMGLTDLALVNPWSFPDSEASKFAAGAEDLLAQAQCFESFKQAIAPCTMVVACTARSRGYDRQLLSAESASKALLSRATQAPVALVFGPERSGLASAEVELCTHRMTIDADPEYSSLNLAAAVQILCYELRKQYLHQSEQPPQPQPIEELPNSAQIEQFYSHLQHCFTATGFIRQKHPGEILQRLRFLFNKSQLSSMELNILRGMLRSVDRVVQYKQGKSPNDPDL